MSDRIDEILGRMGAVEKALNSQRVEFADLKGELRGRCPNNERRIGQLEKGSRNGRNGSGAGISFKALLAALAVITVLAGALATVATHALGVP